jgi:hypothetical protein
MTVERVLYVFLDMTRYCEKNGERAGNYVREEECNGRWTATRG